LAKEKIQENGAQYKYEITLFEEGTIGPDEPIALFIKFHISLYVEVSARQTANLSLTYS
jgi:hypothetical protein